MRLEKVIDGVRRQDVAFPARWQQQNRFEPKRRSALYHRAAKAETCLRSPKRSITSPTFNHTRGTSAGIKKSVLRGKDRGCVVRDQPQRLGCAATKWIYYAPRFLRSVAAGSRRTQPRSTNFQRSRSSVLLPTLLERLAILRLVSTLSTVPVFRYWDLTFSRISSRRR